MMKRPPSIGSWQLPPIGPGASSVPVCLKPVEGRTRSWFATSAADRAAPPNPTTLWSSIALRFGGFTANFSAAIEPLATAMPDAVARIYFAERLRDVVELSGRNPAAAQRLLREAGASGDAPWTALAAVACGDREALLSLIGRIEEGLVSPAIVDNAIEVARIRPLEGRYLLTQLFAQADTASRLRILGAFVEDARLGSTRAVGDLFVKLMARSTPEERRREIYPALSAMVDAAPANSVRGGFLAAMFRGWLSECPAGEA